ncbi:hypothetical protein UCDDS831_g03286 [Diplodia seriata]|uniref:Transmembrane protein 184-like protein n=1 Tax=Diplodia seriata TaxID=420778 RepID=A0A0G2ELX8_9PEZI|nr:hypothetical protein UCDDS831_g03286 [Diplodia seriata]
MGEESTSGGTGGRFGSWAIIVTGVAALVASLLTVVSVWLQTVPIFSAASWASLISLKAAFWIDPFRDVYEAFTIYTFFQLLLNFIGGERALIILMHGRAPVPHLWPLNYVLPKIDISDPHTFLAIKRGILQYTWVKPMLAIATIVMKATGTYQEGYIGVTSGYFWSSLIYNVSITVCLYALAVFWVCMSHDLKPFRPMPKFLCIKGIIFASYWQGFCLSILVWLGAIPDDVPGYTPDNLAASIQDALICFEMPVFAIAHWYAFSWHDYADRTISAARMPVKYALRDAFGSVDLIQDTKDTFAGKHYEYRYFDARDNVLAHEESASRVARMMEGMRYERGGKGKALEAAQKYGATEDDMEDPELNPEDERLFTNARALEFGDWNSVSAQHLRYLVVEDHEAEEVERVRARKEGGPGWNEAEPKHFVRTYPEDGQEEEVREGFDPDNPQPHQPEREHNLDAPFTVGEDEEAGARNDEMRLESDEATQWQTRDLNDDSDRPQASPHYGSFREERSIWSTRDD